MEYTRSIGDYYESFEGTPSEIAALIELLDKKSDKHGFKMPKVKLPSLSPITLGLSKKESDPAKGTDLKGGEE